MTFTPERDGTLVTLTHDGWERLGKDGGDMFRRYDAGWDYVLGERFGTAARRR